MGSRIRIVLLSSVKLLQKPICPVISVPHCHFQVSAVYLRKKNPPELKKQREKPSSITADLADVSPFSVNFRDPIYAERVAELLQFFSKKDVEHLALTCPEIFLQAWIEVYPKLNYALFRMKLEQPEVIESGLLNFPLERIVMRHMFLERCGVFKVKNPKKTEISPNPSVASVVASSDTQFVKLAGVSLEEFAVFSELFEVEQRNMLADLLEEDGISTVSPDRNDDSDNDSETEENQELKDLR